MPVQCVKNSLNQYSSIKFEVTNPNGISKFIECNESGKVIPISNFQVGCEVNGTNCTTYKGNLTCPMNFDVFCSTPTPCPNFCSSNGFCFGGYCTCVKGFKGADCSQIDTISQPPIQPTCSAYEYLNTTANACQMCDSKLLYCKSCYAYGQNVHCSNCMIYYNSKLNQMTGNTECVY